MPSQPHPTPVVVRPVWRSVRVQPEPRVLPHVWFWRGNANIDESAGVCQRRRSQSEQCLPLRVCQGAESCRQRLRCQAYVHATTMLPNVTQPAVWIYVPRGLSPLVLIACPENCFCTLRTQGLYLKSNTPKRHCTIRKILSLHRRIQAQQFLNNRMCKEVGCPEHCINRRPCGTVVHPNTLVVR